MSWLKGLAGKAEDFLNQIDQNAAVALQLPTENGDNGESVGLLTEVTWDGQKPPDLLRPTPRHIDTLDRPGSSASDSFYPTRSKAYQPSNDSNTVQRPSIQSVRSSPNLSSFTAVISSKPKNDDALMEFLNTPPSSSPVVKKRIVMVTDQSQSGIEFKEDINKPLSRPRTPLKYVENINLPVTTDVREEFRAVFAGNYKESSTSKKYDTPDEEVTNRIQSTLAVGLSDEKAEELKTENRLLQNELRSFNNEMSLLLQRSKAAEKECNILHQKISVLEVTNNECSHSLKSKEEQTSRLELELQQSNHELTLALDNTMKLQTEITKLKEDSVHSSGAQSDALLECRRQLAETGEEIDRIKAIHQQEILVLNNTIHSCASEKNSFTCQLEEVQQLLDECRRETNEWQEKFNKSHVQILEVRAELDQYRVRAQRILQDKEKLISELRGEGANRGSPVEDLMDLELEQLRQERDLVREEAIQVTARLQATRSELAEAERKFETYRDQAADSHSRLQESLQEERKQRQAAEDDCRTHSEGLHSVREELTRQRGLLASKLREREAELTKLRTQLSQRPISPAGDELESRLHALTQTLVQKQTSLETVTTERNALRLQYEKMEIKHREAMSLLYQHQGAINVNDTDDAKARVPSFLEESPFDTGVARRVKRAYSNLDAVSIRTGVFLRRYPLARILVLCYMVLLHVWVMIVLFTYSPEMHLVSTNSSKEPH